jgi:hypothetical protein
MAVASHVDHAEEASVTDVELVVSAEVTPPILERHSEDFVHEGPIQAHELGLTSHLLLDHALLVIFMRSLEVHWHVLCLAQKKTDDKEDNGNLRHHR